MDKLTDYILVTEPLLPPQALKDIIAATDGVEWRVPHTQVNSAYDRTCTVFPITAAAAGKYPAPAGRSAQLRAADEALLTAVRNGLLAYKSQVIPLRTEGDQGFDILRYEVGQICGHHVDGQSRVLSMSIALNDEYEGGEFRFWHEVSERATIRIPLGCALMFPSNFMYGHEVLPITKGTRYSMITWFT